jgi:hypothetical protein
MSRKEKGVEWMGLQVDDLAFFVLHGWCEGVLWVVEKDSDEV